MSLSEDKVVIQAVVDKKALEQIDKLAKQFGLSRSKMVCNLIYSGLDTAGLLKKTGLVDAVMMVQNLVDYFNVKRKRLIELGEEDEIKE